MSTSTEYPSTEQNEDTRRLCAFGAVDYATARRTAAAWYSGQTSPLYALASSGAMVDGLADEVADCLAVVNGDDRDAYHEDDRRTLRELARLCELAAAIDEPEPEPDEEQRADMLAGYVDALLWCGVTDERGEPVDEELDRDDLAPAALEECREDVHAFYAANLADCAAFARLVGSWAAVGHDLYLTRNGHGAGFWDRGAGPLGDRLADMARPLGGTHHFYVADPRAVHAG